MRRLIGAISVASVLVAVLAGPATAAVPRGAAPISAPHAGPALLVATINGGGTANMDDGMGTSVWGLGVKLFSDGSATGQFDCVDQQGDAPGYPGNIWGAVTSWSIDRDGSIVLNVTGKLVAIPGGIVARDLPFVVKIQKFGGAGVGHWTLDVPDGSGGWFTVCFETLTSGRLGIRLA